MATACSTPTAPTSCADALPEFDFSICAPIVNEGEIEEILYTNVGFPLTDETAASEWATRKIGTSPLNGDKIESIMCVAEKPKPTVNELVIDRKIRVVLEKEHKIIGKVFQTKDANYNAMRQFEYSREVLLWYRTAGGKLYGGNTGIQATIMLNHVIPNNRKDLSYFELEATWNSKLHPCVCTSPF